MSFDATSRDFSRPDLSTILVSKGLKLYFNGVKILNIRDHEKAGIRPLIIQTPEQIYHITNGIASQHKKLECYQFHVK